MTGPAIALGGILALLGLAVWVQWRAQQRALDWRERHDPVIYDWERDDAA